MQNYRPCAHLWECSQSGDRKIRIVLHNNRSQFPEEKIVGFFVLQIGCIFMMCKGYIWFSKIIHQEELAVTELLQLTWSYPASSTFILFHFSPTVLCPLFKPLLPLAPFSLSFLCFFHHSIHSFLLILPPSYFLHLSVPSPSSSLF